jgi:hypothetical protein
VKRCSTTITLLTLVCVCSLAFVLTPSAVPAAGCPNEALREEQGATSLPSCLALEMVSPPKKFSQLAFLPSFSADGERVQFTAQAALAQTPGYQLFAGDRYVASRTGSGWQTAATSPPSGDIVLGGCCAGNPSVFTPGLERWVQLGSTQQQLMVGFVQLFGGGLDGAFGPISPLMVPTDDSGSNQIQFSVAQLAVDGASADLATTVIQGGSARITYLPGDPTTTVEQEPGGDRNSYLAFLEEGVPTLELLARDKDQIVWGGRCGAHLGGPFGVSSTAGTFIQGAISADGSRLLFSTRPAQPFDEDTAEGPACDTDNPIRIMRRTATAAGPVIEPLLPGGASEWEAPGDDTYEAASADGTKVYFTSPRKLTASDTDASVDKCTSILIPAPGSAEGCDLYLFDSTKPEGERIVHVSAGEDSNPANVLSSLTAVSGDGSHAYFVAQGVLSGANGEGKAPVLNQPNLYVYDAEAETTTFIATLSPEDKGGVWGIRGAFMGDAFAAPLYGAGGPLEEGGGDGHVLAFASKASLSEDDEDGGFSDIFRYDAGTETIERVSKAAPGGSDNGPFDVAVNPNVGKVPETNFGEQSRWVGEDGLTIGFMTKEQLVPTDTDEADNAYVWKEGALGAVPAETKRPPAVSPSGNAIAFSTLDALLPGRDSDTAEDVYVALEGGGFPEPLPPPPGCNPLLEAGCQGAGSAAPKADSPVTTNPTSGNVRQPTKCKKGFVKKKGRCVKKPRKGKGKAGRDRMTVR